MSIVTHLQAPMPDVLIAPGSRNSHAVTFYGLSIERWELSQAERDEISAYVRQELGSATMNASTRAMDFRKVYLSEAETNQL